MSLVQEVTPVALGLELVVLRQIALVQEIIPVALELELVVLLNKPHVKCRICKSPGSGNSSFRSLLFSPLKR